MGKRGNVNERTSSRNLDDSYSRSKNRKFNPRSKRGSGRNSRQNSKETVVPVFTGSSDNDPSWYTPNNQLIKDVASFPMTLRSGAPLNLNPRASESAGSQMQTTQGLEYVPGILTLYTMPMFGPTSDNYDAINTAANAFFVELRRATSGTSYYEDADAMLYLLAGANILSAYAFAVRVYGLINYYRLENAYTPKALVRAMGVDYDDISNNIANFRASLNQFAYRLQSIALPKVTDYITRAVFMYENVYMDAESSKAQYYMYSPCGFYCYSEGGNTTETAVGQLKFIELNRWSSTYASANSVPVTPQLGLLTADDIISMLNSLLNPILESQDMGYIMADILKAYGNGSMYTVSPIAETYTNAPVYNKEVLMQMENAHIYGYERVAAGVTQSVQINETSLQPYFYANTKNSFSTVASGITQPDIAWQYPTLSQFLIDEQIPLNFHFDGVTPENIMVATRLSSSGSKLVQLPSVPGLTTKLNYTAPGANLALQPISCGSDIVVNGRISYYNTTYDSGVQSTFSSMLVTKTIVSHVSSSTLDTSIESSAMLAYINQVQLLANFDWHPRVDVCIGNFVVSPTTVSQSTVYPLGYYIKGTSSNLHVPYTTRGTWDLDNYTTMSSAELERIHNIAIWGLFTSKLQLVN